ncbi:MAG: hypothetical protein IPK88_12400 [Saprospiraceae bacterium]|nr:hypothetical protein [Candidatus Defluviibacterium haderslevense]
MNKEKFISKIKNANNQGTFLSKKHDPNFCFNTEFTGFYTALTLQMSSSLSVFIDSQNYDVLMFVNTSYQNYYYEIIPNPVLSYKIGFTPKINYLNNNWDRLIVVNSKAQGYHCHVQSSAWISGSISSNKLILIGVLS